MSCLTRESCCRAPDWDECTEGETSDASSTDEEEREEALNEPVLKTLGEHLFADRVVLP